MEFIFAREPQQADTVRDELGEQVRERFEKFLQE